MRVLPVHQVALEWFDYRIGVPLGPAHIFEQILDAWPILQGVKFARIAVIEELAMLPAHILFVLFAVFDLHRLASVRRYLSLTCKHICKNR